MISVVMATYNGKEYIEEQLESIVNQTMQPDEVLIIDDSSDDKTVKIVNDFILKKQLKNWKVKVNTFNVGWQKNFMNGFNLAKGDYIFPCDQDDIWEADKIEKMIKIIQNDKKIVLLAGNYTSFYEAGCAEKISNKIIKSMKVDEKKEPIEFKLNIIDTIRPGCVYCFRKKLLVHANQLWIENQAHDALLLRTARMMDGAYFFNYSVIKFRRHFSNASVERNLTKNRLINDYEQKELELRRLKQLLEKEDFENQEEKSSVIDKNLEWIYLRRKFLISKNIFLWFKLLIRYNKYYLTIRQRLKDLYYAYWK